MLDWLSQSFYHHRDRALAFSLLVIALGLYIATSHPGMPLSAGIATDSAELQRMAYRLGIPHSTGYGLYTMIAHASAKIGEAFGASPYAFITYVSGFFGAIGIAFLYLALAKVAHRAVAWVGVLCFMLINSVWHFHTVAEVQGLQLAITGALLWLILRLRTERDNVRLVAWMAFCLGLGVANHRILAFFGVALLLVLFEVKAWRWLTIQRVALWGIVFVLPITSYAYLYVRQTDPLAIHSNRASWEGHALSTQDITNLIRGTFSGGAGLENNLSLLTAETLPSRLSYVYGRTVSEIPAWAFWAGVVGLGIILLRDWKLAFMFSIHGIATVFLVMAYDADDKSIIYQYYLYLSWLAGFVVLFSGQWLPKHLVPQTTLVRGVLLLPVIALTVHLFVTNFPLRNQHGNDEDVQFTRDFLQLPDNGILYTRNWAQEVFVAQEALDTQGIRTPRVVGVTSFENTLPDIRNLAVNVYFLRRSWIDRLGLDSGATWFLEQNDFAYSGTHSPLFFQVRPNNDPRLLPEANTATLLELPITPEIELYSYTVTPNENRLMLTLYWQANAPIALSYSVYTHLRAYTALCDQSDPTQRLIAQDDAPSPVKGTYPTRLWQPQQIVKDSYFLPFDPSADVGSLALVVGMTDPNNGQRHQEACFPLSDILK